MAKADDKALAALRKLEAELAGGVRPAAALEAFSLDADALCRKYRSVRGLLTTVLPFVGKIPIYGRPVRLAVEFLMGLADEFCGGGTS